MISSISPIKISIYRKNIEQSGSKKKFKKIKHRETVHVYACVSVHSCVPEREGSRVGWLKCSFTSTETVGLLGTGVQDVHLDCHTAPELCGSRVVLAEL